LYKNLSLDSNEYDIEILDWLLPKKKETLPEFAARMAVRIDTTQPFYLVGVSLGGMIATEINQIYHPEKVIIVSSAKSRLELPGQYRFQKVVPVHEVVPGWVIKKSSFVAQPLFEPDRKNEKETCVAMLKDKDPKFLKRTVRMIMKWERTEIDSSIVHIHGDNDHTIPVKNVAYDYLIENGSHMMMLTRTPEIQVILISELN
jgi:esterase/lipase